MKNFTKLLQISFLCFLLGACNLDDEKVKATFVGTVESLSTSTALINVEESDEYNLSGSVSITFPKNNKETFSVGDKIKVGYNGEVLEISPKQITVITIEKIE